MTIDFGAVTNMPVEKHLNHHLLDYYWLVLGNQMNFILILFFDDQPVTKNMFYLIPYYIAKGCTNLTRGRFQQKKEFRTLGCLWFTTFNQKVGPRFDGPNKLCLFLIIQNYDSVLHLNFLFNKYFVYILRLT